ncbi:platelet-derived growth factor beta polypeptide a isoform 1-T1 [Lycodopsis pacificus]
MRSWVLLLLLAALSAARLRLGSAEGDPLPSSLVHLVRNSPVSSVDDLKLLLLQETNAIEEEEDEHDMLTNHTRGRFTRSLVEAQPAQQAACKVRTEVMEVTRSMLDRRNANFLLWPPCVEVQRCSGCCNTRLLQCVPTVSATRYLQVIKIQYMNRKAHYDKAIISVEDHVSCRCQPPSSSSSSSSSSVPIQSNPNPLPPPPPPSSHLPPPLPRAVHPAPPKTLASKADLHRHDDLKHNQQRYRPEERDPVSRQWQRGGYTQLVHWTQPRVHSVTAGAPQVGHGSGYDGSREESGVHVDVHHPDHVHRQQQLLQHQQQDQELRTQHRLNAPQSDDASPRGSTLEESPAPPPTTTNQGDPATSGKTTQVAKQTETAAATGRPGGNETEESGSANSGDSAGAEPANRGTGEKDSGHLTEEERRRKVLQVIQTQPDHQTHLHPHHPQQRPEPTASTAVVSSPLVPVSPSARRAPFRPAPPRRRRKHRKRISKAAIRAMIM